MHKSVCGFYYRKESKGKVCTRRLDLAQREGQARFLCFFFFFEMRSHSFAYAGLKLLGLSNFPVSPAAGITGACQDAWLLKDFARMRQHRGPQPGDFVCCVH